LGNAVARGLLELAGRGIPVGKSVLLLDGTVDYVTKALPHPLPVVTRAKADRDCVSVAAASVLAKVFRDNQMVELATQYPDYGFEGHKGYGSKKHYEALRAHGLTPEHRASWIRGVG
jgi:ribonuclease HII